MASRLQTLGQQQENQSGTTHSFVQPATRPSSQRRQRALLAGVRHPGRRGHSLTRGEARVQIQAAASLCSPPHARCSWAFAGSLPPLSPTHAAAGRFRASGSREPTAPRGTDQLRRQGHGAPDPSPCRGHAPHRRTGFGSTGVSGCRYNQSPNQKTGTTPRRKRVSGKKKRSRAFHAEQEESMERTPSGPAQRTEGTRTKRFVGKTGP